MSRCDVAHSGRENLHHFLPVLLRGNLPLFSIMTLWTRFDLQHFTFTVISIQSFYFLIQPHLFFFSFFIHLFLFRVFIPCPVPLLPSSCPKSELISSANFLWVWLFALMIELRKAKTFASSFVGTKSYFAH